MVNPPYPELDDLLKIMDQAGRHLSEIEGSEGTAKDILVCLRRLTEVRTSFLVADEAKLPQAVPELAEATSIVSGSERRLREIMNETANHLACLVVNEGGETARQYTSYHRCFKRVTSAFNSPMAVHYDQVCAADTIAYGETAAKHETINLSAAEIAASLTKEKTQEMCTTFKVQQNII